MERNSTLCTLGFLILHSGDLKDPFLTHYSQQVIKPGASSIQPALCLIYYKCKNHFFEMKGDVGMSENGNKKTPTQRQNVIQPHPYIFVLLYA